MLFFTFLIKYTKTAKAKKKFRNIANVSSVSKKLLPKIHFKDIMNIKGAIQIFWSIQIFLQKLLILKLLKFVCRFLEQLQKISGGTRFRGKKRNIRKSNQKAVISVGKKCSL